MDTTVNGTHHTYSWGNSLKMQRASDFSLSFEKIVHMRIVKMTTVYLNDTLPYLPKRLPFSTNSNPSSAKVDEKVLQWLRIEFLRSNLGYVRILHSELAVCKRSCMNVQNPTSKSTFVEMEIRKCKILLANNTTTHFVGKKRKPNSYKFLLIKCVLLWFQCMFALPTHNLINDVCMCVRFGF